jgi:hypothetical protein
MPSIDAYESCSAGHLVGAHRKLVERVLALEAGATSDEGIV